MLCVSRSTPCVDICAYAQMSWASKNQCVMHQNHHFTVIKNRTISNSAQTWVTARCDIGTFLCMLNTRLLSLESLMKQSTSTTACNLVCLQSLICLLCQNLRANITSDRFVGTTASCTMVWYAWKFCALGTGQSICVNHSGSETK